ncbi:sulfite exporter TauE/SafE family protein [Pirellulaceae bacterium SH501]
MSVAWASWELLGATAVASLLGSLHCVGMCGPFALLATATRPSTRDSKRTGEFPVSWRMAAYHVGRLTTYLTMGLAAGLVASTIHRSRLLRITGEFHQLGFVIGCVLIAIGVWRLVAPWVRSGSPARSERFMSVRRESVKSAHPDHSPLKNVPLHRSWVEGWSRGLSKFRGLLPKGSAIGNAYFWGLTSTLLPCGWLYLFVLAAMAAPHLWLSVATMGAFWLGTLPLLSLSVWGWNRLGSRFHHLSGPIATLSILLMGGYFLASRRSPSIENWMKDQISASSLQPSLAPTESQRSESSAEFLRRVTKQLNEGLPCCDPSQTPDTDKD